MMFRFLGWAVGALRFVESLDSLLELILSVGECVKAYTQWSHSCFDCFVDCFQYYFEPLFEFGIHDGFDFIRFGCFLGRTR